MPSRYRRIVAAVVVTVAAIGPPALIAGVAFLEHEERGQQRTKAGATYSDYTDAQEYCAHDGVLPGPQMTTCAIERAHARYGYEHDQTDLRAQQEVAVWTGGLFWLAFLGYLTGVLGLALLYANLQQVNKANRLQRLATDAAVRAASSDRAWILRDMIEYGDALDITFDDSKIERGFFCSIGWRNCGRSPAHVISAATITQTVPKGAPIPTFDAPMIEDGVVGTIGPDQKFTGMKRFIDDKERLQIEARTLDWYAYGIVWYRTIYDDEIRISEALIEIQYEGPKRFALIPKGRNRCT